MADYLPPVVAKLTGDDSGLTRTLTAAKESIRRFAADVGKMKATVSVDAKLKDGTLAEIRRRINEGPAAKLKVELDLAAGAKAALQERLKQDAVQVTVKPVMDQTALRRVQIILGELGKRIDVSIRPQVDGSSQRRTQTVLDRLSRDRTVTIRTRTIGGGSPSSSGSSSGSDVKLISTLVSLAPALVPIAAQLVTVAGAAAAATVAVGAFGAAVIPQIKSLGDAATAHTKYNAAVTKYGAQSTQAVAAQKAYADVLSAMPAATQQAAGGFMVLKDSFKKWSDGLSQFTMAPVTRSFAVVQAILPKLNPLVKDASTQFGRLVTAAGAGVSSPGFDSLMKRFSDFADKVLTKVTDGVMHLSREMAQGQANGPIASFMTYVKTNGPLVKDTLTNLWKAVSNIAQASAQAGPGMLTLVNALAKIVAALPPEVITRLMQMYTAFKLIKLAGAGISPIADNVRTLGTRIAGLQAVSVAAGGGLAGLRAAFASLNTAVKAGVVIAVIAGLALAAYKLSQSSKEARISVDDLARSIEKGLAAGAISSPVIDDLRKAQQGLVKDTDATASSWDKFWYSFTNGGAAWKSSASSTKAMANDYRDLGSALGQVAQNKGVDTATQALKLLNAEGVHIPTQYLKDYNNALADQQFEAQMAAASMGLFGDQAQAVQGKLAAQKASADGLRQSIQALNDVNRAGLDGQIGFAAAIDAATKAYKDNGRALHMKNGELQLGSEKARNEATALNDLAAKTDANTAAARDSGKSWATVNKIYKEGRDKLEAVAHQMGLSTTDAKTLADQILKTPDKTAVLKGNMEDLQAKLDSAKKQLKDPNLTKARKAQIQASIKDLQSKLAAAKTALGNFNGSSATATIKYNYVVTGSPRPGIDPIPKKAYGGVIKAFAGGGTVPGYAPMRDIVPAILSPGEGVLVPEAVRRLGGDAGINHINRQARGGGGVSASFAAMGGHVTSGLVQGLTAGVSTATATIASLGKALIAAFSTEMGIQSPSTKMRTLGAYVTTGLVQGLTGTTSQVKSATKKIASMLYTDFGSAHKGLQKTVAKDNAELLKLAAQRDTVVTKLKAAKTKLSDLQKSWTAERDQISSGIMSGSSIVTAAPQSGAALTGQDVLNSMRDQMAKTVQFAANLKALKAKGMRSDLIEQLAAAGVDSGGETAAALAASSKGTIAQINSTQKSMKSAADATGATVADSMYAAGIKSAKGLVKGLQSQEKAIEKQMDKIAKSMERAIKKALGIKSPSTVMAALGDNTAKGMAVGINRSSKHAVIAAQGMAMSVRQGATITGGPLAVGGAGGGGDVHNHFEFHIEGSVATVDNLARDVEAAFLRRGMRNPVTYQSYKR